jgi:hypothetical protein
MTAAVLTLAIALVMAGNLAPETVADSVTLRDGKVILGQLVEPAPRGRVAVLARRAWAEEKLPELLKRWESEEGPALRRALRQRRVRLEAWKRERSTSAEPNDRILVWINQELGRLGDNAEAPKSPLMIVTLPRSSVKGMVRRPKTSARLLRLGWRSGFPNPETRSLEGLKSALEARGFNLMSNEPVGIDDLLPIPAESEDQWLARRAATEVTHDTGLKFLRVGPMIIPEIGPGQPIGPGFVMDTLPDLTKILDGRMPDPLPERLREVSARGRVGALVTQQDMSPDLDAARVEITFWARRADGHWVPYGARSSTVRTADLKEDEIKALATSGEVGMTLTLVKSFGFGGEVTREVKQAGLNMGAATRKALEQARSALQNDLANFALSIEGAAPDEAKPR